MTSKFVATALLAALVATGCGASAEEKEVACWAKRQALLAEIAALQELHSTWPPSNPSWVEAVYGWVDDNPFPQDWPDWHWKDIRYDWNYERLIGELAADLPDC